MKIRNISKIQRKMSVGNSRNFPLNESGVIVVVTIGVAGLSPKQAEEEVQRYVDDYKDMGEISQHVKFYKEYFIASHQSENTTVDVKVI